MIQSLRDEITEISKEFAETFKPDIPSIKGSGTLIVNPLSDYLESIGYEHELLQAQEGDMPIVLILIFYKKWIFIPAGSDVPKFNEDWIWIEGNRKD